MQTLIQMEMWNMKKRENRFYNFEYAQAQLMNWLQYEFFSLSDIYFAFDHANFPC